MPIKPENKKRYPKNWKTEIRPRILERAGHCCEGSPGYPDCRAANYSQHPVTGSKVVLTIAHLDHTPENCDDDNLKAWCQRCHLNYDKEHHAASRKATAQKNHMRKTGTQALIAAMRILASDIQGGDGTVNAVIAEVAERMEELEKEAIRYRYLRNKDLETIWDGGVFACRANLALSGDDLDSAIDEEINGE